MHTGHGDDTTIGAERALWVRPEPDEVVETDDGARLATWTSGAPGEHPAVVLLHGGPGMFDYLEPVADLLSDLTLVHRHDQRGCGLSTNPGGPAGQTVGALVDDLDRLRRHWGHEECDRGRPLLRGHPRADVRRCAPDPRGGSGLRQRGRDRGLAHALTGRVPSTGVQCAAGAARPSRRCGRGRSAEEEVELLTLLWFTDYVDDAEGLRRAGEMARAGSGIDWEVNRVLAAGDPVLVG